MKYFLIVLGFLPCAAMLAANVELQDTEGRTISVELLALEGEVVTFLRDDGKRYTVPLDRLSPESRDLAESAFYDGRWATFFPNGLVDADGKPVSPRVLEGKFVGLYFSASWCGPCRPVTEQLKAFREVVGDHFEVVFISQDRSEAEWSRYMRDSGMKWPAVKWADFRKNEGTEVRRLMETYQGFGIPHAVILSPEGEVIDRNARSKIQFLPEENLERLEAFDYDGALERHRQREKEQGRTLTREQEETFLRGVRSNIENQIREFRHLSEQTSRPRANSSEPTWEQVLARFYETRRDAARP